LHENLVRCKFGNRLAFSQSVKKKRHDVDAWLAETQFWQEKLSSCSFFDEVKISTSF
jgi:hypothetical protein